MRELPGVASVLQYFYSQLIPNFARQFLAQNLRNRANSEESKIQQICTYFSTKIDQIESQMEENRAVTLKFAGGDGNGVEKTIRLRHLSTHFIGQLFGVSSK